MPTMGSLAGNLADQLGVAGFVRHHSAGQNRLADADVVQLLQGQRLALQDMAQALAEALELSDYLVEPALASKSWSQIRLLIISLPIRAMQQASRFRGLLDQEPVVPELAPHSDLSQACDLLITFFCRNRAEMGSMHELARSLSGLQLALSESNTGDFLELLQYRNHQQIRLLHAHWLQYVADLKTLELGLENLDLTKAGVSSLQASANALRHRLHRAAFELDITLEWIHQLDPAGLPRSCLFQSAPEKTRQ